MCCFKSQTVITIKSFYCLFVYLDFCVFQEDDQIHIIYQSADQEGLGSLLNGERMVYKLEYNVSGVFIITQKLYY